MPIRSKLAGTLDEADLAMLESVLARSNAGQGEEREQVASRLIHLYQSGVTDPDELVARVNDGADSA